MGRTRAILLAIISMVLTSCLNGGGDDCDKSFDKYVEPDSISDTTGASVSVDKLGFLYDNGGALLEDVQLEADLDGQHKRSDDIRLAMNGIKLSRNDGGQYCDGMDYDRGQNVSHAKYKIHKMALNGGLSFDIFLNNLKRQHGDLRIAFDGKGLNLKRALLHFKGKSRTCPNPPDDPPVTEPQPAAHTKIDSVTPGQSPTSSTGVTIAFSADQTNLTFWCVLDGGAAAKCSSPQTYAGLQNGAHAFKVYSQNSDGAVEDPPVTYAWTVDTAPPSVMITDVGRIPTLTNKTTAEFSFTSNEAATFKCSLDDATFEPCVSPRSYSGLGEGGHSFAVRAIDEAGNVSGAAATFAWTVDLTAPAVSIVGVSPAAAISNVDHRLIEFAAGESADFECSVDNGPFAACQSPVNLQNLAEGAHWFEVKATDMAGNIGPVASVAWRNDYTAPVLSFGVVTPAPGLTGAKKVSAEFAADEPAVLFCQQDDGAAAECASPLSWEGLTDGPHALQVYAVDMAGNQSQVGRLDWTVDATAPTLSFTTILPSPATYLNSADVSFGLSVSEDASVAATLNGTQVPSPGNPIVFTGLPDGAYRLVVSATDGAGNISGELTHDFVIDTVAPTLTMTADDPRDPTNLDKKTFAFSASEDVTYQCNVDGAGYADCQSPLTLSGLADGLHMMFVRASDPAGNAVEVNAHWTVDTRPPVTTIAATQNIDAITFTLSADEAATFTCAMDGAAEAACASPVDYSGLAPGTHHFSVYATDAAGNRDAGGVSYEFEVIKPIVTSITAASPAVGALSNSRTATFTFTADQTASGYLCALDGAAEAPCESPMTYQGLADGAHHFLVKAVDAFGRPDVNGATSDWSVDATAPTIPGVTITATVTTITIVWSTSEPATEQVRYGAGFTVNQETTESTTYSTTHSYKLVGLSSNTTYSIQVYGRDAAGNEVLSSVHSVKTSR